MIGLGAHHSASQGNQLPGSLRDHTIPLPPSPPVPGAVMQIIYTWVLK
jgi:hypothetical protein